MRRSLQPFVILRHLFSFARVGRLSFGLSPPGLLLVYLDWLAHLAFSPGKQQELVAKAFRKAARFGLYAGLGSLARRRSLTWLPSTSDG